MIDPPVGPDLIGDAMSEPGLAPDQLVDLLRADQRRRWQSGRPLPVASKRRPKPYPLLTKPRKQAQDALRKAS